MKKWKILDKQILVESPLFRFFRYKLLHGEKNSIHNFYILDTNDWVNIIPITTQGEVVLIKQYRAGTDQITIEIPGGIMDDNENDPIATAKRELEEETGFIGNDFELLGFVNPNPSFITNKCYFVLAKNVEPLGKTNFDPSEFIETFTLPMQKVLDLISEGKITHSLTLNGLFLYLLKYGKF